MPVGQLTGSFPTGTGRGINVFFLREMVKARYPGLDDSQYLQELNFAYKEVWEELMQMDEMFFSDIRTLTVAIQGDQFDLVYNSNAALNGSIPRLHQIHRIRIQQAGSGTSSSNQMIAAEPRSINDSTYLSSSQTQPAPVSTTAPYYWVPFGEGQIKFARPLPVGTIIEVWFTYSMFDMQILNVGTITSTGVNVTGAGTAFTQIVPPDLQPELPSVSTPTESQVGLEIIAGSSSYRVVAITSDTALQTLNAITPALTASPYILATVPELPAQEHRVIADLATRNILSTPANDERYGQWAQIAAQSIMRMKNTVIQRQRQTNARKKRFPFGTVRRARFFGP